MTNYYRQNGGSLTERLLQEARPYKKFPDCLPILRYECDGVVIHYYPHKTDGIESIIVYTKNTNLSLEAVESFFSGPDRPYATLVFPNINIICDDDHVIFSSLFGSIDRAPEQLQTFAYGFLA